MEPSQCVLQEEDDRISLSTSPCGHKGGYPEGYRVAQRPSYPAAEHLKGTLAPEDAVSNAPLVVSCSGSRDFEELDALNCLSMNEELTTFKQREVMAMKPVEDVLAFINADNGADRKSGSLIDGKKEKKREKKK